MKLFKSLLVAPATIGLLAPFSTFAGEANLNDISKYSNLEHLDLANAFVNDEPNHNPLLAGGEGLVESSSYEGGFSETETKEILSISSTIPVSLGKRILRSDTATTVALFAVQSFVEQ